MWYSGAPGHWRCAFPVRFLMLLISRHLRAWGFSLQLLFFSKIRHLFFLKAQLQCHDVLICIIAVYPKVSPAVSITCLTSIKLLILVPNWHTAWLTVMVILLYPKAVCTVLVGWLNRKQFEATWDKMHLKKCQTLTLSYSHLCFASGGTQFEPENLKGNFKLKVWTRELRENSKNWIPCLAAWVKEWRGERLVWGGWRPSRRCPGDKTVQFKHCKRETEERAGVGFATQAVGPVP